MKSKLLPFIPWIKKYQKKDLISDVVAWVILAIILLPKSMAYASIAWLPLVYWIYTNLFSPWIAALWGSSEHLSTWAAAVISFLVFSSVSQFANIWSFEFIQIAIILAVMVWIIQLLLWFFKRWAIMNFISHSVIKWFTNAAALIIIASQLKDILWVKAEQSDALIHTLISTFSHISETNLIAVWIWILSIIFILLSKKIHKLFPWTLIIIAVSTFITYKFWLDHSQHLKIIWEIPAWLPKPWFPLVNIEIILKLIPISIIMAIIWFTEAFSVWKMIATKTKQKIDVNQELIWQWFANLITGFFKWFPVSGSFSGTAVNYSAWAKTWMSNIIASIVMIIFLLFFTKYLFYLPKTVLAAIVIVAVSWLINFKEIIEIYKLKKTDWIIAIATFACALFMKPDYAIFLWVVVSLIIFLRRTARPKIVPLGSNSELNKFVDAQQYWLETCPQILIVRPEMSLYFANAEYIFENFREILNSKKETKYLLIECWSINNIDATAFHELHEFIEDTEKKWIEIFFINLKSAIIAELKNNWMYEKIWANKFMIWKNSTLKSLLLKINLDYCKNKCPHKAFNECNTLK